MALLRALPASEFKLLKPGDKFWVKWYDTSDEPEPQSLNEIQTVLEISETVLLSQGRAKSFEWLFSKLRADTDNVFDTGVGLAYFFAAPKEQTASFHCTNHPDDEDRPHIVIYSHDEYGEKTRCLECDRVTWR